ncbi:similar to hypothetical protein FLJ90652, isoform CRA_d [Rattus norvegicus]|uniref:Uncharacterized protein LOC293494 n=1 Tax=Rattus norvegicus TaxID=10116 RepID=A6I9H3_RAT|nr:similar to hypothetical protein FLJ90652, isoform CRA_d [Rattus norvegicus]
MNGPADGEVDYKKKYRNLKRKLKFLIYVSTGVGRLWSVRPSSERTSVYPCGKGGTRVLPGGAQEGAKKIAEGFPRQEFPSRSTSAV